MSYHPPGDPDGQSRHEQSHLNAGAEVFPLGGSLDIF
jgi:hypothetical protein